MAGKPRHWGAPGPDRRVVGVSLNRTWGPSAGFRSSNPRIPGRFLPSTTTTPRFSATLAVHRGRPEPEFVNADEPTVTGIVGGKR